MIVMKKNSLKLNELVRSELELTEQAVIKGGRTTNEAYSNKHGAPTA